MWRQSMNTKWMAPVVECSAASESATRKIAADVGPGEPGDDTRQMTMILLWGIPRCSGLLTRA